MARVYINNNRRTRWFLPSDPAPGNILDPAHSWSDILWVKTSLCLVPPPLCFLKDSSVPNYTITVPTVTLFLKETIYFKMGFLEYKPSQFILFSTQAWINNHQGLAVTRRRHRDQMVALQPHEWGGAVSWPGCRSDSNPRFEKHLSALNCSYKELGNTWLFSLCGYGFPFFTIKCH